MNLEKIHNLLKHLKNIAKQKHKKVQPQNYKKRITHSMKLKEIWEESKKLWMSNYSYKQGQVQNKINKA